MRKQIALACEKCGKIYSKDLSEYKRNSKLNRINYCSLKCAGKDKTSHLNEFRNVFHLSKSDFKRGDDLSPFRQFLQRVLRRTKDVDITLEYLKDVWDSQGGICPYTGYGMVLFNYKKKTDPIRNASLDRIDSSKGYIKGNVQFVVQGANFLKHTLSHSETIEICKQIAKHWGNID